MRKGIRYIKYAFIAFLILLAPTRLFAVGWTPTDAGFVLNFEPGDQFLLSVWIDLNANGTEEAGEEFFVCDYPSYNGGRFGYRAENYMKLVPQAAGATKPSEASIWTIREPIKRVVNKVNYDLGGICYTMWGNSGRTLYAAESLTKSSTFKFLGYLTDNENHGDLCDVVIVVPSDNTRTTNMDPNNTLGRASETGKFNGRMGTGFLGMTYREVYLFDIPRQNTPIAYTNASLVTFNTSNSTKSWSAGTIKPGFAAYAFADTKHNPTTRTVFRIYPLNKPFVSAEGTYFFGWDVQDYTRYRQSNTLTDSTSARKIYTLDHFVPMKRVGSTQYYQTEGTKIPSDDSTYYYVGKNNTFYAQAPFNGKYLGSSTSEDAKSAFKHISNLRVRQLKDKGDFRPSKNAYGYLAIDTTLAENNLGVTFEPAGYFFQTSSGVNVPMRQIDDSTWMSEEMWYIADKYMELEGRVVLYTDSVFSSKDPGTEISGWSQWVKAPDIPVAGTGGSSKGKYGWPRVHTNRATPNGGIEFVEATNDTVVIYHNNGHFGADIPYQYPIKGEATVTIQDARLLGDYKFYGWAASANGEVVIFPKDSTSKTPRVGQTINLRSPLPSGLTLSHGATGDTLHLYAKATYEGSINLAISFMQGDKRYFLTHPGTAPRFARARTFEEWTDVYQGMSDEANSEPNYLSTYKMIANPVCALCAADEVVLDPRHETMHGSVDSLTFYEYWTPANDEYIGLYYTTPNTVIANNTWAGAFKSSGGWPTPANPCVASTKISSTHYFTGMKTGEYVKNSRGDLPAYIKYNSTDNQFDGDAVGEATDFMISGVGVVDEHYIILPDTTNASTPWRDEITFDAHNEVQLEQVWSKLIGKQLLAQMKVGDDTIYFHPNRDKTFNTANELRLSNDYRLRHEFEFIPDRRAIFSSVAEANRVTMEETENAFCCNVYSGASTPVGPTQDIVDTLRVWLRPASTSKIKEYFGRWKKGQVDSILADGSRYRDILIKTKTYHYGSEEPRLILKPEQDSYSFGAMENQSQTLNFLLLQETSQALLDAAGTEVGREIVSIDTIKSGLDLTSATATLKTPALNIFTIGTKTATTITLSTQAQNAAGAKTDTLTVTIASITVGSTTYTDVTAKVPLTQSSLQGDELVWSVVKDGKRYFIMAGSGGLIFREYNLRDNTLYKLNSTTALIKGAANAENSNNQYITPWKFTLPATNTIALKTELPSDVNKYIAYSGSAFTVGDAEVRLTYKMVQTYANENANYEEKVRLKYATDGWLVFDGSSIRLTANEEDGSIFYWGYLQKEYNLLNNSAYPSVESLAFGYNNGSAKAVQTRYKAFSEYSMLLDNKLTYLCRAEVTDISTLGSEPWGMSYTITKIDDSRFEANTSGLGASTNSGTLVTTITPASATSPTNIRYPAETGPYVDIVDTLEVSLSTSRTDYRFTNWEGVSSIGDAHVKIPLIRKTYHSIPYDSIFCAMEKTEYNFAFPSSLREGVRTDSLKTFHFETVRLQGTNVLDVDNNLITSTQTSRDTVSGTMDLSSTALAEIRLVDEYGQIPDWCEIEGKTAKTITVRCKSNGVRAPRTAYLYFAYIVDLGSGYRYVNFKLAVSQASLFQYANNQTLIHTSGASGDPIAADGRQQAHENRRILYYYNPKPYDEVDQNEELPVRERGYYGWWRWYREGKDQNKVDVGDTDVPDSVWVTKPRNVGKFNYPFRIIGDSVMLKKKDGTDSVKVLVTMGRYTVFHYPSRAYNNKKDPPAKNPMVKGPWNKDTVTYVVDISNYYDNLPLSMAQVNQIDTAVLDTMKQIIEPTLSLREVFELHPWTEMAEKMENYKTSTAGPFTADKYMEDHELMAPIGNRLLLRTEQRYNYKNLEAKGHTESLLGYYMRDDNWNKTDGKWTFATDAEREACQDTMIWCGGWDADCEWYTYKDGVYTKCNHPITEDDDFLNVPAKAGITAGQEYDTVYYCLRARSKKTADPAVYGSEGDGDYWFNICRYKIIYHDPRKYGPIEEKGTGSAAKALISNDDIEQNYEVLERLNFDYVKTGKDYHIYPHPLPWEDASYGYSYPVTSEIPTNRYHDEKDFPGPGEYALINKIPYSTYWRKFEQHGGAENGFMIYCDGMSSAGQVAALSLETQLCEGQKMYFSGYIGNVSNQTGKSNPNFTFSVQGWEHESKKWVDITSYMTGDIKPSDKWYQIFFPINQEGEYDKFRIRIYNVASDFDGNDFVIDDMCVFATKPPLIAYQANTRCVDDVRSDSINHVVLRVDYQGFVDHSFNSTNVYYTVQQNDAIFVPMMDGYLNEHTVKGADASKPDTIFGYIPMPHQDYIPMDEDSIFTNIQDMVNKFENSYDTIENWIKNPAEEAVKGARPVLFNKGYLYESLDGMARPVLYVVHKAKVAADNTYKVRMSVAEKGKEGDAAFQSAYRGLLSSKCAVTSDLKITNRMVLELNGEEVDENDIKDICANSTYDLAMGIKGSLFLDSVAPMDVKGSCINDWLLYGDTTAYSTTRYGYSYHDIKKVIKDILRSEDPTNTNLKASNLAAVNRNVMQKMKTDHAISLTTSDHPYDILAHLVSNGFLTLYQANLTTTVAAGDSVQYMIFPIFGTGTSDMTEQGMEVCPTPILVKLKPDRGGAVPMIVGGIKRDSTEMLLPVEELVNARTANDHYSLHIDSILPNVAIHNVSLLSTNDPNFYEGLHLLNMEPDRIYSFGGDNSGYYKKGDDIIFRPASSNNYTMQPGYTYTFGIVVQGLTGSLDDASGCPIGTVPFTLGIVPDYLRWAPQSKDNNHWNDPNNWIGVDDHNDTIPFATRFAPIASTDVIIPAMTDGMPYPKLPVVGEMHHTDSIRKVNFVYNTCDDIRFMAGAAISQQQRLTCDVVVADMSMPYDKWAFRSAPLTGMISGDLFMAEADLSGVTKLWSVGTFDASGRSYTTGNASFWLSLYSRETRRLNNNAADSVRTADADWSRVTNAMKQPLVPAQGWAVYTRTASKKAAEVRLPKSDDIYYYYGTYGEQLDDRYESGLNAERDRLAGGSGKAGKLAYTTDAQVYTISNEVESTSFVFGNPTMGYIDIWGVIADNCLKEEFHYMDESPVGASVYSKVTKSTADLSTDAITTRERYLPPMRAIVVQKADESAATELELTLNASRIVTEPDQCVDAVRSCGGGGAAPALRAPNADNQSPVSKGIMTVIATNSVSPICTSRLLLGQGYHDAVREGEDAVLTTICIDNFSMVNAPATPFNLYAVEGSEGLCIDLKDSIVNVPVSFYISDLPYDPVTRLWFTGVNNIDGQLVFYDALLDTERPVIDGTYIDIETPQQSHIKRYYIRRRGFTPGTTTEEQVPTGFGVLGTEKEQVVKIIQNGQVLIIRNGHIFTMFGQKVR